MTEDLERRLIQWTGERIPPAGLLARLRAIHPKAELVDGGSEWWLGIVEPNPYRRKTGERILARCAKQLQPVPSSVRLGHLMVQHFTLVAKYPEADGAMVEDFRRRCWQHDHDPNADDFVIATRLEASADERRKAQWRGIIRERLSDVMGLLRHRVTVGFQPPRQP